MNWDEHHSAVPKKSFTSVKDVCKFCFTLGFSIWECRQGVLFSCLDQRVGFRLSKLSVRTSKISSAEFCKT